MKFATNLLLAAALCITALASLLFKPVLNFGFAGSALLIAALIGFIPAGVIIRDELQKLRQKNPDFLLEAATSYTQQRIISAFFTVWIVTATASYLVLQIVFSRVMFAETYSEQLERPVSSGVALPDLDLDKAPLVSEDMAMQAAIKLLSEDAGMGSQVRVGDLEKQLVNGELVWVGFLEHNSVFRYLSNKTVPGYVIVSAHDATKTKLVRIPNMHVNLTGYFADSVEMQSWKANLTTGRATPIPELDDAGHPYWVVPLYRRAIWWTHAEKVTGVQVIDATTGKVDEYSVGNAPAWIDRLQPSGLIEQQVNDWGTLSRGFINATFSGLGVIEAHSIDLVYGEDGRAYYYASLTSAGSDNGISGALMVDSRTGKVAKYDIIGASEQVAKTAIEGLMPEKHYGATNPLPFLIEGEETYVAVLRDSTGIARAYGLMSIRNYQNVVAAESLQQAARLYRSKLSRKTGTIDQQASKSVELTARVLRKAVDIRGGNSQYLMTLSGRNEVFVGSSDLSDRLPLVQPGDQVKVGFSESGQSTVNLISFSALPDTH